MNNQVKCDSENAAIIDYSEYVFIIDSDKLDMVETDLIGFAVTPNGIFTRNNISLFHADYLDGTGTYIYIERHRDTIIIRQDFSGNMGLYLFRHNSGKFVISNSFYSIFNYLKDNYQLTFNQDYANHFITTWITSLSYDNTAVKEIELLSSDAEVIIDISNRSYKINHIPYNLNSIPLDSIKAIRILDHWYSKWINIIRGIARNSSQFAVDLSGGFDSRLVFLFVLKSGIDLNTIYIRSLNDGLHTHSEDYAIAKEISEHYGFKLNNSSSLTNDYYNLSENEIISILHHTKWSFHKEWTFPNFVRTKTRYYLGGFGGETIRPYWNMPAQKLLDKQLRGADFAPSEVATVLHKSIETILNNTFLNIQAKYHINDSNSTDYSFNTFRECYSRNHFGKICFEALFSNTFKISPIMDPLLQQLQLSDRRCIDRNLLIALIFERFGNDLLNFRFDGGRKFDDDTLDEAKRLSRRLPILTRLHNHFAKNTSLFILPTDSQMTTDNNNHVVNRNEMEEKYYNYFCSDDFKSSFIRVFDESIYEHIIEFTKKQSYFPLRHIYAAIPLVQIYTDIVH